MNDNKNKIISALKSLYKLAKHERELNKKIDLYQFYASSCWHNYSNTYVNVDFERDLLGISKEIITTALPEYNGDNNVLHVMTQAYFVGGHTRVVENWIKAFPEDKHSLIVNNNSEAPDFICNVVNKSGGIVIYNQHNSLVEKAKLLARVASSYKYVVLHHHPHDILPLLAFGNDFYSRPTFFYNHADHVWGCGYSVADYIFELCIKGVSHSVKYRGIPQDRSVFVGIPLEIDFSTQNLQLHSDNYRIITMATENKYEPIIDLSFQAFIEDLFESNENICLDVIGVYSDNKTWNHLYSKYKTRIIFHGLLPKNEAHHLIRKASLYLDSFPLGSSTSLLEALSLGVPAVSYKSIIQNMDSYDSISFNSLYELKLNILKILSFNKEDKINYFNKLNEQLSFWHNLSGFSSRVQSVIEKCCFHTPIRLENSIADEFVSSYSDFMFQLSKQNYFRFDYSLFNLLLPCNKKQICQVLDENALLLTSTQIGAKANILEAMEGGILALQLYYDNGRDFNAEQYLQQNAIIGKKSYSLNLEDLSGITRLRLDPINQPAKVKLLSAYAKLDNDENYPLELVWHNADLNADVYDFKHDDPQMVFNIPVDIQARLVSVEFVVDITPYNKWDILGLLSQSRNELHHANLNSANYQQELSAIRNQLQSTQSELQNTQGELHNTQSELQNTQSELQSTQGELQNTQSELHGVYHSKSWQITKPLRKLCKLFKL